MGCAGVTIVHSISSILLFISFGFFLASCIVPHWLRYEPTDNSRQYYLGLFEYCYNDQTELVITRYAGKTKTTIPMRMESYRCVLNSDHRTSFPLDRQTPIIHALHNVTVGLILTSAVCCFLGAIFATFCSSDSSVGVSATVFWMMTNFVTWSCSLSAIAFFAAKRFDQATLGMSFYFACIAMVLTLISMIMSFIGPCMAYNAEKNELKKKRRSSPSIQQPVVIEMKELESVRDTKDTPVEELCTAPTHKSVIDAGNSEKSVCGSIVSAERVKLDRRAQYNYIAEPKHLSFKHQGVF